MTTQRLPQHVRVASAFVVCSVLVVILDRLSALRGPRTSPGDGRDTVLVTDLSTPGWRAAAVTRATQAACRVRPARVGAPSRRESPDVGLDDRPARAGRACTRGFVPGSLAATAGHRTRWRSSRTAQCRNGRGHPGGAGGDVVAERILAVYGR